MSKRKTNWLRWPVIAIGFFLIGREMGRPHDKTGTEEKSSFAVMVMKQIEADSLKIMVPGFFVNDSEREKDGLAYLKNWFPYPVYAADEMNRRGIKVAENLGERGPILLEQMALENDQYLGELKENELYVESLSAAEGQKTEGSEPDYNDHGIGETEADSEENYMMTETDNDMLSADGVTDMVPVLGNNPVAFVPHEQMQTLDQTILNDYDKMLHRFYTVDAVTRTDKSLLDHSLLSSQDMTIDKNTQGAQILIYHTHSQEAFADSVSGDRSTSIVGVGDHLAQILESQYGYKVLHHTGEYDKETRNNAYTRALPEIQAILEENPDIQVVIDLHRDAMEENNRLVMDLDGRKTARFMFFNGISRTAANGPIEYLSNEYQTDNLAFSYQMKMKAEEYYPGLTRKNYINAYRYNMHLCPKTLLIELGAQNNTVEEVMNACDPLAHILDMVLTGK